MKGNVVTLHRRELVDHDATAMGHALGYVLPVDINADFKDLLSAIDLADLAATPVPDLLVLYESSVSVMTRWLS